MAHSRTGLMWRYAFFGDKLTIVRAGGVGNVIEWTVKAVDASGNSATTKCRVDVVNPENKKDKY